MLRRKIKSSKKHFLLLRELEKMYYVEEIVERCVLGYLERNAPGKIYLDKPKVNIGSKIAWLFEFPLLEIRGVNS